MKIVSMVCPNCGASLQVDADQKNLTCNYCGNCLYVDDEVKHVQYDNAEETGYQFEKGRQRAQAEALGLNQQTARMNPGQPPKKRKTWLWVLGWIFIFPLPLTILLLRKKDMKPALKYGLIAAAWVLYLIIALAGRSGSSNTGTRTTTNNGNTNSNITALSFTNTEDITLKVGESYSSGYIKANVRRSSEFSSNDVLFVSDNPDVATISLTKVALTTYLYYEILAVGPGETKVYVTSTDGTVVSEMINVTVPEPIRIERIEIINTDIELAVGDTEALTLEIYPEDAEDKAITWTSSDESVAQVDDKGNVRAIGGGGATITASTNNGIASSVNVSVDGSKRTLSLRVTRPRQDDINIGDEWSYITEVNGEHASGSYTLSIGDILQFYAKFTESDDNPDVGEASTSYTVTEEDLTNGFTVSMDLYVTENGGRNSGKSAHFIVTFTFTP